MKNTKKAAWMTIFGAIVLAVTIALAGCGTYTPWEIVTPATCTTAAREQRTRTDDKGAGKVQTRNSPSNPALGHAGLTGAVAATCTTAGRTASGVCTRCGPNIAAQNINALGHNWGNWRVTRAATTTAEGQEERTCTRDQSHRETRAIARLSFVGTWSGTVEMGGQTYPASELVFNADGSGTDGGNPMTYTTSGNTLTTTVRRQQTTGAYSLHGDQLTYDNMTFTRTTAANPTNPLVGSWRYFQQITAQSSLTITYVFMANGTGTWNNQPIEWAISGNTLSRNFVTTTTYTYTLSADGNTLTLRIPSGAFAGMTGNYTRK
jgi:hypothetical protein